MAKVDLDPNFRELLESLNSAGVRYLVIGGYAVIYYGYHRATDDIDLWIAIDPENAQRVSAALQDFGGFSSASVKPSMFQVKGKVYIFGREPARVDILTSPSALDFEASYAKRNIVEWDGVKVPLIDFEDLKRNKQASGRAKDIADLENLPPTWPWMPAKPAKRPGRKKK
jgi:predicted nucleotidyltransferase